MLLNASPEFVALCRSQVALTQGLGASLSVVYLTEDLTDIPNTKLIPIAAYPDAAESWEPGQVLSLLSPGANRGSTQARLLNSGSSQSTGRSTGATYRSALPAAGNSQNIPFEADQELLPQQQIVLPLIHDDVVMGLLVTARTDRAWTDREQTQVERIASTLSLACVLDQRSQWLDHDLRQQRLLRSQQHDIFDDLLHQFRNPLTALRTFGKLLVRRLLPGDPNRDVATGIVQESDRLQELLKQFDRAIDLGESDLLPMLPSAPTSWDSQPDETTTSHPVDVDVSGQAKSLPLLPSTRFLAGTEITLEQHTVAEVLTPLLDSANAIAQDRQLTLQIHLPTSLPSIRTDTRTLREVLSNLIDNALKYTPTGGTVYVWASDEPDVKPDMLAIAVSDTGPGIPSEDLAHLFERHYRGVQANTDIPGTGLGLAIARDLIHQLDSEIEVYSPASSSTLANPFHPGPDSDSTPNSGTTVVVWLPKENSA
ncbi:MAG TPA: GAF domain-containing sensor histidine kinase [Crinalium sp.]|jgi:hypothetical protein